MAKSSINTNMKKMGRGLAKVANQKASPKAKGSKGK